MVHILFYLYQVLILLDGWAGQLTGECDGTCLSLCDKRATCLYPCIEQLWYLAAAVTNQKRIRLLRYSFHRQLCFYIFCLSIVLISCRLTAILFNTPVLQSYLPCMNMTPGRKEQNYKLIGINIDVNLSILILWNFRNDEMIHIIICFNGRYKICSAANYCINACVLSLFLEYVVPVQSLLYWIYNANW